MFKRHKTFDAGKIYQGYYNPPAHLLVERSSGTVLYTPLLHDKWPYLIVLKSNPKHTEGFNLHYFPYLYYKIPVERYQNYTMGQWNKVYTNLKKLGLFDAFFDEYEEMKRKNGRWDMWYRYLKLKGYFNTILPAYRRYFTEYLTAETYE